MANASFYFGSQADAGTVTASSEQIPASNVLDPQRSRVWRSAVGQASFLDINLPGAGLVDSIVLIDTNLSSSGTIRVQVYPTSARTTASMDFTFNPFTYAAANGVPAYGLGAYGLGAYGIPGGAAAAAGGIKNVTVIPLPTSTMDRFFRITFTDATTSFQQLGRLFVGQATMFSSSISYGWTLAQNARSASRESIGGQRFVQPRPQRGQISGQFEFLSESDRNSLAMKLAEYGEDFPFVFSVYPETSARGVASSIYGRFAGPSLVNAAFDRNTLNFSVLEEL